ncbi:MAG: hypothetical protein SWC40_03090 [Thermodesulfobacteriota bacterium]|nr:hypothetical protein [Thermodesulfobacteriota bacterium]
MTQQFSEGRARSGKPAGLMVVSVYPIGEMREIEPPSDGKGSGALCAVLDMDGERVPACSVDLDEVVATRSSALGARTSRPQRTPWA